MYASECKTLWGLGGTVINIGSCFWTDAWVAELVVDVAAREKDKFKPCKQNKSVWVWSLNNVLSSLQNFILIDDQMKWLPELFVVEKGPAVELKVLLAAWKWIWKIKW